MSEITQRTNKNTAVAIYRRPQVDELVQRLNEPAHHLIVVEGPRQTGKTTLIKQALEQVDIPNEFVSLDELHDQSSLSHKTTRASPPQHSHKLEQVINIWQRARDKADNSSKGFILVLDEIPCVPEWSRLVKGLWDRDLREGRDLRVVLLGSAPILLQARLSESLLGRFELIKVKHWSLDEMHDAFGYTLEDYIYFGGYPGGARFAREDEERWRDYVLDAIICPSIDKDILALNNIDKPALFRQLFETCTEYSSQILSYNKMLGQLQDAGNTTTLARYLDLLGSAELLIGLQKFSPVLIRTRSSSPKLSVFNTSLMTANSTYSYDQAKQDRTYWGRLVESSVGAYLLNAVPRFIHVEYWKDGPFEVNFVLRHGRKRVAIEVKSGLNPRRSMGLQEFSRRFSPVKSFVVGEGGMSLSEFFSICILDWFQ